MFGPTIYLRPKHRMELRGTPLWVPAMLLAIIAFSMGLAWSFFVLEELWSETGMSRFLHSRSSSGHYVASWPFALMTLAIGLPWMLALTQVHLRGVTLDADEGTVSIRPLGPLSRKAREISIRDIAEPEVIRVRASLLNRLTRRSDAGTRPVLRLKAGGSIALVKQPLPRAKSEKIVKMARKVLPADP